METRIYVYTVKNPDSILENKKPIVKPIGPYVFDQVHERKVREFVNSTLSYETFSYFKFNENKSCDECFLYNRVWVPNMIYQVGCFFHWNEFILFRNLLKLHRTRQ